MPGYFALVLHAHLPFVRHPEHDTFLEESWLFEAITEVYVPLLQRLEGWQRDGLHAPLTLTLSPTLCSMLQDPLLQARYARHLDRLIELVGKELHRTRWEAPFHESALFYQERFKGVRDYYLGCGGDLVGAFRRLQDAERLEIITSAATHAVLPLLAHHPPSVRAQLLVARDHYRSCFGRNPSGLWLPECAYNEGLENFMQEAGFRWFILDAHGLLRARPKPRYAVFAPILLGNGMAAFARDPESANQVWSRQEGYPGDPRYREFYRDIGFDLEFEYVKPHLAAPDQRGFTGIKYFRITGGSDEKAPYHRPAAMEAAKQHAHHFLEARMAQLTGLAQAFDRPPLLVSPYDAELFGHWWYEGPEFLDCLVRQAASTSPGFSWITPSEYLRRHPTHQLATPSPSSWGEDGYWGMWLSESNEWIYPHLQTAQERMTQLVRGAAKGDLPLQQRALKQAARDLLLAQASDWPFILRTGTSPDYARKRLTGHLLRFTRIYEQLTAGCVDDLWLRSVESSDNIFPEIDYRYWDA